MKKILVTGAAGQIGSELIPALRKKYGVENVIASGHETEPPADIKDGPFIRLDIVYNSEVRRVIKEYNIRRIFHLASILSALGEQNPQLAFNVNVLGLYNILEAARESKVERVIVPSTIAAFGPDTPKDNTPNETIQRPTTMYGISKVFQERLGDYYYRRYGLDVRGLRFPGIISWKTEPKAGTTDYAVAIFYEAIRQEKYTCYLKPDTRLPMMYMPDAVKALIDLSEADIKNLKHHSDFNAAAMSFTPEELAAAIRKEIHDFKLDYKIDPLRQAIADSWPRSLDDSAARKEWGWKPGWDINSMTRDMLANLRKKLGK